jgi:hypothetical protein
LEELAKPVSYLPMKTLVGVTIGLSFVDWGLFVTRKCYRSGIEYDGSMGQYSTCTGSLIMLDRFRMWRRLRCALRQRNRRGGVRLRQAR